MRPTVDFDSPQRLAIEVRDQCVASFGMDSGAATTTTCSSVIFLPRGAGPILVDQPAQAPLDEPRTPPANRRPGHPQRRGEVHIRQTVRASTIRLRNAND
jgi:hypothetical protein